jgi:predicted Zn-dependent protease
MAADNPPETPEEMHREIIANMPLVEGKLADYVNQVGQRIVRHSDRAGDKFTFTVIDNPDINAFALPDGYIYIHRGLIGYLNSEAQLAAVLAHEIGHVTARHHTRQKRAQTGSKVISGLLAVLTRRMEVGQASALWGASLVSGYGRDMELEADEIGSRYLYKSGYDPQAMIEVISLLKDHERLEKKRARESGREPQTYHGLFATHPRNDQRLREVVSNAGSLPNDMEYEHNVTSFRIATEGMVWGENVATRQLPENVYLNEELAFVMTFPKGWQFSEQPPLVNARNDTGDAKISVTAMNRTRVSPDQFIKQQLDIPLLKQSEPLSQFRLQGHTGLIPGTQGQPDQRLAVIYYGYRAFVFRGTLERSADHSMGNRQLMDIIGTFRPVSKRSLKPAEGKNIHYVKATPNSTFALLAEHLKLGKYGEDELRIINNHYPVGEPEPGEWIKIIR